jgi:hypothetical protein
MERVERTERARAGRRRVPRVWTVVGGGPPVQEGVLDPQLRKALEQYLRQQNKALEAAERERLERERRATRGRQVAQTVTYLVLLTAYAMAAAALTSERLVGELLLPSTIVGNVEEIGHRADAFVKAVPELAQTLITPVIASGTLLLFRSTSRKARAGLGGIAFGVVMAVALLGLATSASSGVAGMLAALPGAIAALVITCEFTVALSRLDPDHGPQHIAAFSPGTGRLSAVRLRWAEARAKIDPAQRPAVAGIYVSLPLASAGLLALIVATGPVAHLGRVALAGMLVWSVWAWLSMPSALRAVVWSLLATSVGLMAVLAFGTLATMFAVEVLVIVVAAVGVLTVRRP